MGNKKLHKENSPESEILYESSSESESKSESKIGTFSMSYNSAYCVLNILIHCLMVNIQLIELNPEGTQILDSDSRPRDDKKRKRSNERRYQYVSEMTKDLREALRRDLFWNLARMPQETQLDIEKTFESQKDLVVKTIVPNLMKTLDLDTYPIGEGVIYEMIYQRHRHKRDNLRVKNKSENDIKKETGRKHQNLRRSEKRKKRSKTINNLRNLNDPLIQKFSNEELRPIITENGYHSLEISESEDGQNIIVVCNLQWCSSTLRRFLYYVDSNTTKGDKKRERMYKPSEYVEETVPNSTPSWTKSGYDGPLKNPVIKAISKLQNK
ncbi:uncharacterized protein OCT59_008584 [Rhizophagus irregularis]|uniref:uncharacterized protein n=1 Tax=Rhizophagus irregularis TaxID=588596 RepID=UPI003321FD10|nr:hypothetical protein OCT59_008584 [Rhizophagus irregularis]